MSTNPLLTAAVSSHNYQAMGASPLADSLQIDIKQSEKNCDKCSRAFLPNEAVLILGKNQYSHEGCYPFVAMQQAAEKCHKCSESFFHGQLLCILGEHYFHKDCFDSLKKKDKCPCGEHLTDKPQLKWYNDLKYLYPKTNLGQAQLRAARSMEETLRNISLQLRPFEKFKGIGLLLVLMMGLNIFILLKLHDVVHVRVVSSPA